MVAEPRPTAGDDAAEAAWHPLRSLPLKQPDGPRRRARTEVPLAFDHAKVIEVARARLQEKLHAPTLPSRFRFVPQHFTLTELQRVYESVFGREFDEREFRARMLASAVVRWTRRVAADERRLGSIAGALRREAARSDRRCSRLHRWDAP